MLAFSVHEYNHTSLFTPHASRHFRSSDDILSNTRIPGYGTYTLVATGSVTHDG